MLRLIARIATAGALLAVAGNAVAGSTLGNFLVSATVAVNCKVSTSPLSFGAYTPGGGPMAVNTVIGVFCTKTSPFTVKLNPGSTAGGSFGQRLMGNTTPGDADTLQYNLYTTAAFGTVFGDGTAGTGTDGGVGLGMATSVNETVYGQLLDSIANQNVSPGTYNDTITVTVAF